MAIYYVDCLTALAMTNKKIYVIFFSCISMESGTKPELNAQRYAVLRCARWLSLSKLLCVLQTSENNHWKLIFWEGFICYCCESGNFGTRLLYERISQLLESAQVRFPGRKK